jgi:hypothetical protein
VTLDDTYVRWTWNGETDTITVRQYDDQDPASAPSSQITVPLAIWDQMVEGITRARVEHAAKQPTDPPPPVLSLPEQAALVARFRGREIDG